jgi:hypothetical protein
VIVFGSGLRQDKEQPWEEFHSFEMRASKSYILEELKKMQDEQQQAIYRAIEKAGNNIIPAISWPPTEA